MSVRETYDLPRRPPVSLRFAAFMTVFSVGAVLLWLVLPDSPVTVALLAIALLAIVFAGVSRIFTSREVTEAPPHRPGPSRATD
jgi:membrane protein implicated in regulation of membrane protease activity